MLLENRNAIVYGGAGAIGGAIARAYAREGATVHLVGRTAATLAAVADDIRAAGGTAETAQFDASDEPAVNAHANLVAADFGSLDISCNVLGHEEHFGTPVLEMPYGEFEASVTRRLRSMWLTCRAAVPHMTKQGSGVLLAYGGYGPPTPNLGGFQVAFGAIEALRRTLARELGPSGIRVITIQTAGVPESLPDEMPAKARAAIGRDITDRTLLGRPATLADVGNAAVFAASDMASALTATKINITAGAVVD